MKGTRREHENQDSVLVLPDPARGMVVELPPALVAQAAVLLGIWTRPRWRTVSPVSEVLGLPA